MRGFGSITSLGQAAFQKDSQTMSYLPPNRTGYQRPNSDALVISFPIEKTVGLLPNDPKMEFLFACLDGHPNVSKKRLLMLARSPEVGFIGDQQAQILISALGLEAA